MQAPAQLKEPNPHATTTDSLSASAQDHSAKGHRVACPQDASVTSCLQGHELHDPAETAGSHEGASQSPTLIDCNLSSKPPIDGDRGPPKEPPRLHCNKRQLPGEATLPVQVAKFSTGASVRAGAQQEGHPTGLATMFELCAGSASLSVHAQRVGFHTYPVDHAANRFRPRAASVCIDMSQPWASQLLVEAIHRTRPVWLHAGLPCGTCSRARDRPISKADRRRGAPEARPLRDDCNLKGRPDLTQHERDRVALANAVCVTAEAVLYACYEVGVALASKPGEVVVVASPCCKGQAPR